MIHIIGTRPNLIKAAPLINAIGGKIINTGQHFDYDMADIFFARQPDYNLNVNSLSHGAMTGRMIEKIEEILLKEKPEKVIVYGDVNSALAGAIAASKLCQLIHVEAGVRSHSRMPEETNRILIDRIADINFCSTYHCIKNLERERLMGYFSGDLMLEVFNKFPINPHEGDYVLVTIHRQENTEPEVLNALIRQLEQLSCPVKFIKHPRIKELDADFEILSPLNHFETLFLIANSKYVITDSGGIVREAYWLKKKTMFLMDSPVWSEIETLNTKNILMDFDKLENLNVNFDTSIFGDGHASEHIKRTLCPFI